MIDYLVHWTEPVKALRRGMAECHCDDFMYRGGLRVFIRIAGK